MAKKITIIIEDDDNSNEQTAPSITIPKITRQNYPYVEKPNRERGINTYPVTDSPRINDYPDKIQPVIRPTNTPIPDNGWVDGNDICASCPNNPKNGGSGICFCTIPHMYGPNRITCTC